MSGPSGCVIWRNLAKRTDREECRWAWLAQRLRGWLQGAAQIQAESQDQLMEVLQAGLANRVVAATAMNAGGHNCRMQMNC